MLWVIIIGCVAWVGITVTILAACAAAASGDAALPERLSLAAPLPPLPVGGEHDDRPPLRVA